MLHPCALSSPAPIEPLPISTFGDVAVYGLQLEVYCQTCHEVTIFDATAPALRSRRLMGARFRCRKIRRALWNDEWVVCEGFGRPTIGPPRALPARRRDTSVFRP